MIMVTLVRHSIIKATPESVAFIPGKSELPLLRRNPGVLCAANRQHLVFPNKIFTHLGDHPFDPRVARAQPWAGICEHLRCWILPYCRPICFLTVRFEETDAFTLVVEGIGEIEVPPTIILALVYVPYWPT